LRGKTSLRKHSFPLREDTAERRNMMVHEDTQILGVVKRLGRHYKLLAEEK
jgi:hypothetical protein